MREKVVKVISDTPFFASGICQSLKKTYSFVSLVNYNLKGPGTNRILEETKDENSIIVYHCSQKEGLSGLRLILKECIEVPIVAFCCIFTSDIIKLALKRKSVAVLSETANEDEFKTAFKRAMVGKTYLSETIGTEILESLKKKETFGLTSREIEIINMMASGLKTSAVAAALGISRNTVRNHMANLYAKLSVEDRTSAVLRAMELGLVSYPQKDSSEIE